ncbi:MAG TPA: type II secretion system F family protein [Sandaracinaceae bacterium LLY-WYZ-13_1]|nr:type II secretion system F family protein [Sandaracinaceae bacterium LLY-WYZ-13_1]
MSASATTLVLGYAGIVLLVVGTTAGIAAMVLDPSSDLRKLWGRYENALERQCRFLLIQRSGASIARMQLLACAIVPVLAFLLDEWILALLVPPIALAPYVVLQSRSRERVQQIEDQLDSWLMMLSNALKASPSLGEALGNSAKLMRAPMSEELDLALKEMKLGTPLDQAVLNMSTRVGSPAFSSALATILVGRQTGGDLPKILEESAATLREMARLEGVVRTKTAEGKTQAYVLGVIPFALIGAIHLVDEHWLEPLGETGLGFAIIAVAATLWLGAIFLARRILAVDI